MFRSDTKIYLVIEYAPNGDILSYINECVLETQCGVGEDRSRELFKQIATGVAHCHQLNVVHRLVVRSWARRLNTGLVVTIATLK